MYCAVDPALKDQSQHKNTLPGIDTKNSGHSHLYFVATNDDDGEKYQTKLLEESFFGLTFYAAART